MPNDTVPAAAIGLPRFHNQPGPVEIETTIEDLYRLAYANVLAARGVRALAVDQTVDETEADGLVELAYLIVQRAAAVRSLLLGENAAEASGA